MIRRLASSWGLVLTTLLIIIAVSGIIIWIKSESSSALEITLIPPEEIQGNIYVSGGVNNPGIYPFQNGDTIATIIRAAGGMTDNSSMQIINLYVSNNTEAALPQRVDINRAEAWLLAALPGIGEVRAQDIIDYRQANGLFRAPAELADVPGIGTVTYEKIKDLITVTD
jgi:competence protein ComEA